MEAHTAMNPTSETGMSYHGRMNSLPLMGKCRMVNRRERMDEASMSPKHGSAEDNQRREESPTKRAVQKSVTRNERVTSKPRAPIPACPEPARTIPAVGNISSCRLHIRLGKIGGSQAAPAIEITLLILFLLEEFTNNNKSKLSAPSDLVSGSRDLKISGMFST